MRGHLIRRRSIEIDVTGERTEVPELIGTRHPELLLLNDEDLTYAKIRLDERSLKTAITDLSRIEDSLARALVWGAAWDMTRDAEMSATDFVRLVLANIGQETDAWGISRIPVSAAQAVNSLSAPANRAGLQDEWERGLRRLLAEAAPDSDQQLTFMRSYAAAAHSEEAIADLEALLDGSLAFDGLRMDQDLRWALIAGLARVGRVDDRIDVELARDNTISGKEHAAAARASQPTAEAKAQAWETAVVRADTPNETQRSIVLAFQAVNQDAVLEPYVEKYLEVAETLWEHLGTHKASVVLNFTFPRPLASPELVDRVGKWLEATTANPAAVRYVREGRADLQRYLAAQEKDAEAS
jgi:aminopeptidase N